MNSISKCIVFFGAGLLLNCGGGGDDSAGNQAPTGNNGAPSATTNNTNTLANNCNISPPVCTISVTPSTSVSNRAASGTHFYLVANCNTSVSTGEWFEGKDKVLTGKLDLNVYPTVSAGYTLDIPYQFNYSNCAGSSSAQKWVYIRGENTTSGGGNTGGGSGGGSNATPVVTYDELGWYKDSYGGDIYRIRMNNKEARSVSCVINYSATVYNQIYKRWEPSSIKLYKSVSARSSILVDMGWEPQKPTTSTVLLGTPIKGGITYDVECK